ncbi:MAG: hypothetical protein VX181_06650, partial [Pseudomonadota bacterium]|nr:hypothetical protein [Pseudomonadota bacterium]
MLRTPKPLPLVGTALTLSMLVSACVKAPMRAVQALPDTPTQETTALAVTKDNLDVLSGEKKA